MRNFTSLPLANKEAPNLVDPFDWAILSHWALEKQSLLTYAPENTSSPMVVTGKWLLKN
jgi:hypothetical protein